MISCDAAAILAGGTNKRLGHDKALLQLENQFLLDRIYIELSEVINDIRVIGQARPASRIDTKLFFSDLIAGIGPMGGLFTALHLFSGPVLLVPCDMPLIRAEHIWYMLEHFDPQYQAIVANGIKGIEPLFAIYLPQCLPQLRPAIENGDYALHKFINKLNAKFADFTDYDRNSDLFFNINTLSDYKKALYLKKHRQI